MIIYDHIWPMSYVDHCGSWVRCSAYCGGTKPFVGLADQPILA